MNRSSDLRQGAKVAIGGGLLSSIVFAFVADSAGEFVLYLVGAWLLAVVMGVFWWASRPMAERGRQDAQQRRGAGSVVPWLRVRVIAATQLVAGLVLAAVARDTDSRTWVAVVLASWGIAAPIATLLSWHIPPIRRYYDEEGFDW